jgi:hypothetical protein
MPRMSKEWYRKNGLPMPKTFERKTYNWYIKRGLVPPSDLSVPKNVAEGPSPNGLMGLPLESLEADIPVTKPVKIETDEEIEERLTMRFMVFESLVDDVINGDIRGLIVSGPPGMGKSYPVEQRVRETEIHQIVKGHASARGLYELLYNNRHEGAIVVMDDADSIFGDETALNLLKSALDTTEDRNLSWITASSRSDDNIPTSFKFEGSIIFITNLDFDGLIARGSRIAKHLEAIISRTHYIDLMLKNTHDFIVRIKQVIRESNLLPKLTFTQKKDVIEFIEANAKNLREISLRTALKVGALRKSNQNWEEIAKITCCKHR